jgi:hypothetical protein
MCSSVTNDRYIQGRIHLELWGITQPSNEAANASWASGARGRRKFDLRNDQLGERVVEPTPVPPSSLAVLKSGRSSEVVD